MTAAAAALAAPGPAKAEKRLSTTQTPTCRRAPNYFRVPRPRPGSGRRADRKRSVWKRVRMGTGCGGSWGPGPGQVVAGGGPGTPPRAHQPRPGPSLLKPAPAPQAWHRESHQSRPHLCFLACPASPPVQPPPPPGPSPWRLGVQRPRCSLPCLPKDPSLHQIAVSECSGLSPRSLGDLARAPSFKYHLYPLILITKCPHSRPLTST